MSWFRRWRYARWRRSWGKRASEVRLPRRFDYPIMGCTLPLPCGGYVTHHTGLWPRTEVHECEDGLCLERKAEHG